MRVMRLLHRYGGLVTALVIVIVSVTGILLVHKKELGLNKVSVPLPGSQSPMAPDAWSAVVPVGGSPVVGTKQGVFRQSDEGWGLTLPAPVRRLHLHDGTIYACAKDGLHGSSDGGATWRTILPKAEVTVLHFAAGETLAATTKGIVRLRGEGKGEELIRFPGKGMEVRELMPFAGGYLVVAKEGIYTLTSEGGLVPAVLPAGKKGRSVELQKLVTDLHTGAIIGGWGMVLADLAAVGLVLLTISGIWLWYRPWRERRRVLRAR